MATERSAGPRWPAGVRAAASTAIPVVIGLAAGDLGAGLIATIGAFTSGFGSGRPYFNRGVALAVIAVTLALAVTLGAAAAPIGWLGVLTVTAVGVTAVWLCNALAVGPPGAYIFVVACAAGVGVSAAHLSPWRIGLLVLGGGAIAWMVHMAAMVTGFRRPERAAVAAAGEAVATYIEAAGTDREGAARHRAAAALQQSWNVLISYQPMAPPSGSVVHRLRAANHALHVLFATAMSGAADHGALPRAGDAREVAGLRMSPNALAAQRRDPDAVGPARAGDVAASGRGARSADPARHGAGRRRGADRRGHRINPGIRAGVLGDRRGGAGAASGRRLAAHAAAWY
jgi:hypothetical protein